MRKTIAAFLFPLSIAGCGTSNYQPPVRPQLTQLESCLQEASSTKRWCVIGALGTGRTFNDATAQANVQTCEDRASVQEDRCYARLKK